jgi:hypothetical protein
MKSNYIASAGDRLPPRSVFAIIALVVVFSMIATYLAGLRLSKLRVLAASHQEVVVAASFYPERCGNRPAWVRHHRGRAVS